MLDNQLEMYYEDRFSMFLTKGWKDLIEDLENLREPLLNIRNVKTDQELQFRKGQVDILDWLLSLPKMSEDAWKQLQEDVNAPV